MLNTTAVILYSLQRDLIILAMYGLDKNQGLKCFTAIKQLLFALYYKIA